MARTYTCGCHASAEAIDAGCNHVVRAYKYEVIIMQSPSENAHALELIDNGFLEYAASSRVNDLEAGLKNSFDIYDTDNFRIAHIDAEELAEFSFDFFLPNLNEVLAKRQFELLVSKLNEDDSSFDIVLNGNIITLYDEEDLRSWAFWDVASRVFFRKVNKLLVAKGLDEQFYLFYSGNDLQAMLLTDGQYNIIADYYKDVPNEVPYKP
ncbi:MAG: hypothetical protein EOO37_02225 [Cytophagaceae bacterium]|nr:MAG: hypothetical protein EOO37_02225 [Cytophagaceae bacterium]